VKKRKIVQDLLFALLYTLLACAAVFCIYEGGKGYHPVAMGVLAAAISFIGIILVGRTLLRLYWEYQVEFKIPERIQSFVGAASRTPTPRELVRWWFIPHKLLDGKTPRETWKGGGILGEAAVYHCAEATFF
jgi:hypothetical protein